MSRERSPEDSALGHQGSSAEGAAGQEPTVAECIEAGLYFFARDDFEAARAWWERAVALDPSNARAQECLRILQRVTERPARAPEPVPEPQSSDPGLADDLSWDSLDAELSAGDDWQQSAPPKGSSWDPADQLEIDGGIALSQPPPPTEGPALGQGLEPKSPPISEDAWNSALSEYMQRSQPGVSMVPGAPSVSRPPPGRALSADLALDERWDEPTQDPLPVERMFSTPAGQQPVAPAPQRAAPRQDWSHVGQPVTHRREVFEPLTDFSESQLERELHAPDAPAYDRSPPPATPERYVPPPAMPQPHLQPLAMAPPRAPSSFDINEMELEFDEADPTPIELLGSAHPSLLAPEPDLLGAQALDAQEFEDPSRGSFPPPSHPRAHDPLDLPIDEPDDAGRMSDAFSLGAFGGGGDPDDLPIEDPIEPPGTTPWDFGPAATTAVTMDQAGDEDALAELTPLPVLNREPLFQVGGEPEPPPAPRPSNGYGRRELAPPQAIATDPESPPALLARARDRFQLHDFDGALELLERIPPGDPTYDLATDMLDATRRHLEQIYASKIGPFDATPRLLLSGEELIWLNLNHRAGFILSQVDGYVTYEDLVALSGMPRLDTLRILCTLLQEGVIGTD